MELAGSAIGVVLQFAVGALVLWVIYRAVMDLISDEVLKRQGKLQRTGKVVIPHPQSGKIQKTPQEEVAESVRFALRTGVTPAQLQDIMANEVSQYHRSKAGD